MKKLLARIKGGGEWILLKPKMPTVAPLPTPPLTRRSMITACGVVATAVAACILTSVVIVSGSDSEVREYATQVIDEPRLSSFGFIDDEHRDEMLDLLSDDDPRVRASTILKFGNEYSPDPRSVVALTQGLSNGDLFTRIRCARALSSVGRFIVPQNGSDPDLYEDSKAGLDESIITAGETLVAACRAENETLRQHAVEAIGSLGINTDSSRQALEAGLHSPQFKTRLASALALGKICKSKNVPLESLLAALNSEFPEVICVGCDTIAKAEQVDLVVASRVVDSLIPKLDHPQFSVCSAATQALLAIGEVSESRLIELARSSEAHTHKAAWQVLARMPMSDSIAKALEDELRREKQAIDDSVLLALTKSRMPDGISPTRVVDSTTEGPIYRRVLAIKALSKADPNSVAVLRLVRESINSPDEALAQEAAESFVAIAAQNSERSVVLLNVLKEGRNRELFIKPLKLLNEPAATELFKLAAKDELSGTEEVSLWLAQTLGIKHAVEDLKRVYGRSDQSTRVQILEALSALDPSGAASGEFVLAATQDSEQSIRLKACELLNKFPDTQLPEASYLDLVQSDDHQTLKAALPLAKFVEPTERIMKALAEKLQHPNLSVRVEAVHALRVHASDAAPAIMALGTSLHDADDAFCLLCLETLAQLDNESRSVLDDLRACLDRVPDIRLSAARILLRLDANDSVLESILPLIGAESPRHREQALRLALQIDKTHSDLLASLEKGTKESEVAERISIAELLIGAGVLPRFCATSLVPVIESGSDAQRFQAAYLLGKIGKDASVAFEILLASLYQVHDSRTRNEIGWALIEIGRENTDVLVESLQSDKNRGQYAAASAIVGDLASQDPRIIDELSRIAADKDEQLEIRENCIRSLGQIGIRNPRAVSAILGVLNEDPRSLEQKQRQAGGLAESFRAIADYMSRSYRTHQPGLSIRRTCHDSLLAISSEDSLVAILNDLDDDSAAKLLKTEDTAGIAAEAFKDSLREKYGAVPWLTFIGLILLAALVVSGYVAALALLGQHHPWRILAARILAIVAIPISFAIVGFVGLANEFRGKSAFGLLTHFTILIAITCTCVLILRGSLEFRRFRMWVPFTLRFIPVAFVTFVSVPTGATPNLCFALTMAAVLTYAMYRIDRQCIEHHPNSAVPISIALCLTIAICVVFVFDFEDLQFIALPAIGICMALPLLRGWISSYQVLSGMLMELSSIAVCVMVYSTVLGLDSLFQRGLIVIPVAGAIPLTQGFCIWLGKHVPRRIAVISPLLMISVFAAVLTTFIAMITIQIEVREQATAAHRSYRFYAIKRIAPGMSPDLLLPRLNQLFDEIGHLATPDTFSGEWFEQRACIDAFAQLGEPGERRLVEIVQSEYTYEYIRNRYQIAALRALATKRDLTDETLLAIKSEFEALTDDRSDRLVRGWCAALAYERLPKSKSDQALLAAVELFSDDYSSYESFENADSLHVFVEACRRVGDKDRLIELLNKCVANQFDDELKIAAVAAFIKLGRGNEETERLLREIAEREPDPPPADLSWALAMVGVSARDAGIGADPGSMIPMAIEALAAIDAQDERTIDLLLRRVEEQWRERQIAAINAVTKLIPNDPRTIQALENVANNKGYQHVRDSRVVAAQALSGN
jgi:hypothetical protein